MAFDAGSIVAKLKLNSKEFTAGLTGAQAQVKKFDLGVGAILRGGLIVGSLSILGKKFISTVEEGARIGEISLAFDRVAGSIENANNVIEGTRKATASLSNTEIKQLANRLSLVGVQVEQLPRLAKIAEAIGDSTGESTKQVLEAIITGTARSSDRMLTAIGLNVDLKKATDKYAASLGLLAEDLTEAQKQQVFINELFGRGDTIITQLGNNAVTAADQMDAFKTSWVNFFERMKKDLSESQFAKDFLRFFTPEGLKLAFTTGIPPDHTPAPSGNQPGRGSLMARANAGSADAGLKAEQAAKAAERAWAKLISRFESMDWKRMSLASPRNAGGDTGIMQGNVADHGLTMGDTMIHQFSLVDDALSTLGDSFSSFFEEIVTGSGQAGRAFFSGLMTGLAGIASSIGDLFIQTGIGMIALSALNPFAAIAAGIALKVVAGAFRGVGNKNAPSFSTATEPRRPRGDQMEERGNGLVVHVDNFIGNKAWMEDFVQMLRKVQRERGVEVVFT